LIGSRFGKRQERGKQPLLKRRELVVFSWFTSALPQIATVPGLTSPCGCSAFKLSNMQSCLKPIIAFCAAKESSKSKTCESFLCKAHSIAICRQNTSH
jgi:hypothetical protein